MGLQPKPSWTTCDRDPQHKTTGTRSAYHIPAYGSRIHLWYVQLRVRWYVQLRDPFVRPAVPPACHPSRLACQALFIISTAQYSPASHALAKLNITGVAVIDQHPWPFEYVGLPPRADALYWFLCLHTKVGTVVTKPPPARTTPLIPANDAPCQLNRPPLHKPALLASSTRPHVR